MPRPALPLALVLAIGTGCYVRPPLATKPNAPQKLAVDAGPGELVRAVRDLAHDQGWMLVTDRPRAGRLVAVGPAESSAGLVTRDRWVFFLDAGSIAVQHFLEYIDDGQWVSPREVCDTYAYAAERSHLATIENRVTLLRAAR